MSDCAWKDDIVTIWKIGSSELLLHDENDLEMNYSRFHYEPLPISKQLCK